MNFCFGAANIFLRDKFQKPFFEEMVEGTGWDSTKNYPKTIPEHVGSGFEWSGPCMTSFAHFHDLDTAIHVGSKTLKND